MTVRIQLNVTHLETGETQNIVLETPIAIGSIAEQMPTEINGVPVSQLPLFSSQITAFHALIAGEGEQLTITTQNPGSELSVNSVPTHGSVLRLEDYCQLGPYQIQVLAAPEGAQVGWACDRQVGFLIRKRCGRTTTVGCPYCGQALPSGEPDYADYAYYPGYGDYRQGQWGSGYYNNRNYYYYDPSTGNVDFTEADAAALELEADMDYEQDMGAS